MPHVLRLMVIGGVPIITQCEPRVNDLFNCNIIDQPVHPRRKNIRCTLRRTVRRLMPVLARLEARLNEDDFEKEGRLLSETRFTGCT